MAKVSTYSLVQSSDEVWGLVISALSNNDSKSEKSARGFANPTGANVFLGCEDGTRVALHEVFVRQFTNLFDVLTSKEDEEKLRDPFGNYHFLFQGFDSRVIRGLRDLLYTGKAYVTNSQKEDLMSFLNEDVIPKPQLKSKKVSSEHVKNIGALKKQSVNNPKTCEQENQDEPESESDLDYSLQPSNLNQTFHSSRPNNLNQTFREIVPSTPLSISVKKRARVNSDEGSQEISPIKKNPKLSGISPIKKTSKSIENSPIRKDPKLSVDPGLLVGLVSQVQSPNGDRESPKQVDNESWGQIADQYNDIKGSQKLVTKDLLKDFYETFTNGNEIAIATRPEKRWGKESGRVVQNETTLAFSNNEGHTASEKAPKITNVVKPRLTKMVVDECDKSKIVVNSNFFPFPKDMPSDYQGSDIENVNMASDFDCDDFNEVDNVDFGNGDFAMDPIGNMDVQNEDVGANIDQDESLMEPIDNAQMSINEADDLDNESNNEPDFIYSGPQYCRSPNNVSTNTGLKNSTDADNENSTDAPSRVDQKSGPRTYARKSTDKYTNTWTKGISNAHSLFRQITNDIKFDPNMVVDSKLFSVGMTFDNVEDFLTPWQAYCSQILTNWRIYNAQTNETHGPRSPDGRVTVIRFTLECVHAGRPRKKQV